MSSDSPTPMASELANNHKARKRFGQNFLHDQNIIGKIVQSLNPKPDDHLIEIGPGLGALSKPVLQRAGKLTCIELDRDVIPILQHELAGLGELTILNRDVLKVDFAELAAGRSLRVFGNLPYNISTPLIFHLCDYLPAITDMLFMLQKEVVERMAAGPEDDAYGRLSVMLQYYCDVSYLFTVPPGAFRPAPKVQSAIVRLLPHRQRALRPDQEPRFAELVSLAFNARRKTLRNVWRDVVSEAQFAEAAIDPILRPENLALDDYLRLTRLLYP
ncbi:16S rRNA (adenine(1518)-N(6)/adenine(1519)-N(6))-dimethyltransferase RsmA [Permianibacter fluminis]|uniref:16S rRNA (adenine(1518)-N(6)/adenine(1519)-N(6))- dimethyltransferase RsmA n=1 Tax=Permianibacter fluminis TaxID=2738515 RepID=UPI0038B3B2F6